MGYNDEYAAKRAEWAAAERAKYAGRVVAVKSFYYDGLNDYTAMLWDPETLSVVSGPSYNDSCPLPVDGPAWVVAFYAIAKSVEEHQAAAKRAAEKVAAEAAVEAVTVRWGKTVKVVRGRKVPKGTVARVFWMGENKWGWSVGLELDNGDRVFTALHNVEVVQVTEATQEAA